MTDRRSVKLLWTAWLVCSTCKKETFLEVDHHHPLFHVHTTYTYCPEYLLNYVNVPRGTLDSLDWLDSYNTSHQPHAPTASRGTP